MAGSVEIGDGYEDYIKWLGVGPSSGADFSWWLTQKFGLNLRLKVGYLFIINVGSEYVEGYSSTDETVGFFDVAALFGFVF
jgi:hypothetical protein